MKIAEKISTTEGLLQFLDRVVRWAPPALGTLLSGGLASWAATATEALNKYGPISWVASGLVGAVLFCLAWWLWSVAKLNVAKAEFAKDFASKSPNINPLDDTFTKQRIDVNTFRTPTFDVAKGKVFVDCELRGPAVVLFMGYSSFSHAGFINCEMVKIKDNTSIYNVIPFENITVRGGKLYNLTILVPESAAKSFPPETHWLTA